MGCESVKKTIGGENYVFGQFLAKRATREFTNLLDLLGLSIGKLIAAMGDMTKDKGKKKSSSLLDMNTDDINFSSLGDSIALLCARIHEKHIETTIESFMEQVIHQGSESGEKGHGQVSKVFDIHFKGRLFHMTKVFTAALEVQYSDFLEGFGGINGLLAKLPMILDQQTSQAGSGISGDQSSEE